jgi:hypothetical protein
VNGARLSARQLVAIPFIKGESPKPTALRIKKIQIEHSQVELSAGVTFQDFYGQLSFRPDATLEKASVENADRSLVVEAQPSPLGLALIIEGRAWQPAGAVAAFASLQAKGILQSDKLLIQNIYTTFLGGILRGNWLLDWSGGGLAMAGDAMLNRIDTRKLGAAFAPSLKMEGDMSGTLKLRATGATWDSLWRNAEGILSTEITRGLLIGVDLGEAARRNGDSSVRAGTTKFDRLRSTVTFNSKQVVSKDLRMDAGMVTAQGQFVAEPNGLVDANINVTLQTSVSSMTVPVRITGNLPDLTAVGRK